MPCGRLWRTAKVRTNVRPHFARLHPFVERARRFSGWEFSDLGLRQLEPGPPWDFEGLVRRLAATRRAALDLGTGGGELLAKLRPDVPHLAVATEEWVVNAPIAHRRLSSLGVHVVRAKSTRLPFRNSSFDIVVDRHEELSPAEVDRVLMPGGLLVTQQVGRHNWRELRQHFPRMTDFGDLRSEYVRGFVDCGFEVESSEHEFRVAYPSLGEFVFMLCVAPWEIPDFDVERDLDALLAFESDCLTKDGLVVTECRYLVIARKPE